MDNIEIVKYLISAVAFLVGSIQLIIIAVIKNYKANSDKNEELQWNNINDLQKRLTKLETEHNIMCHKNENRNN